MSAIMNTITGVLGKIQGTLQNVIDKIFPPEQRAEMLAKLQSFAMNNPKLAAFLTAQFALSGIPLLLFLAFTITVFLFSLIAALLIGLLAAVLFTIFMVGIALIIILPTIFLTTFAASFIFLWGLGGYYIIKWFNEGETPAPDGSAIGDKINSLTGGRMGWLTDGAKTSNADERLKMHGSDSNRTQSNGGDSGGGKKESSGSSTATKQEDGVQQRTAKSSGATKAADTAKGATGGNAE